MVEFTVSAPPRRVAEHIEQCAVAQGNVTALVVPWESDRVRLNMAVTAVKGDGWAIEHTNLGTITLTAVGDAQTQVAITADDPDHPEKQKLLAMFNRFTQQLCHTLQATP